LGSNFGLESLQNPPKKKPKKTLQLRTTLLECNYAPIQASTGNEAQSGGKKWLGNGKTQS